MQSSHWIYYLIQAVVPGLCVIAAYYIGKRAAKRQFIKTKDIKFISLKTFRKKAMFTVAEYKFMVMSLWISYEQEERYERCPELRDLVKELEKIEKIQDEKVHDKKG
jgi:hypothetical protein